MDNFDAVEILIVEDNPHDAELILRALKGQNLANEVHHVEDGEEALDFLFRRNKYADRVSLKSPRVVFLDLKLPKLSGLEVLREIRANPLTSLLPVVIITSSGEDPDINTAYKLGVNSYVVKPVNFDDFIKAVQRTGLYWLLVNESPDK